MDRAVHDEYCLSKLRYLLSMEKRQNAHNLTAATPSTTTYWPKKPTPTANLRSKTSDGYKQLQSKESMTYLHHT